MLTYTSVITDCGRELKTIYVRLVVHLWSILFKHFLSVIFFKKADFYRQQLRTAFDAVKSE